MKLHFTRKSNTPPLEPEATAGAARPQGLRMTTRLRRFVGTILVAATLGGGLFAGLYPATAAADIEYSCYWVAC